METALPGACPGASTRQAAAVSEEADEVSSDDSVQSEESDWAGGAVGGGQPNLPARAAPQERPAASASDRALAEAAMRMVAGRDAHEGAWQDAARWEVRELGGEDALRLLELFGYGAASLRHWSAGPEDPEGHPGLELLLHSRVQRAGHEWYVIRCAFDGRGPGRPSLDWRAPRRFCHLRRGLYDRVRAELGASYGDAFGGSPFPARGEGGASERLRAWLGALGALLSGHGSVGAPPSLVALVLEFFQGGHALDAAPALGDCRACSSSKASSASLAPARPSSAARLRRGSKALARSLSSLLGGSQSGVLPPDAGGGRSLLQVDTARVGEEWVREVSAHLGQDMDITKVGRNGKPYPRKLRVDSKGLMLQLLQGRSVELGVPLGGLVDVLQGLCSKELVSFHKRYRKQSAAEELAKLTMVLQIPERTISLVFSSEAQCSTVGIFVVVLLRTRSGAGRTQPGGRSQPGARGAAGERGGQGGMLELLHVRGAVPELPPARARRPHPCRRHLLRGPVDRGRPPGQRQGAVARRDPLQRMLRAGEASRA
ncbi:unnamed protein product, partial [Prorocentrum cordatum]